MAFLATLRRQSLSLPYAVPALRTGSFALYTPSQAISRCAAPPAVQSNNDTAAALHRSAAAPSSLFGLLTGTLDDANCYTGDEGAAWLADMARGICCPSAVGDGLLVHEPTSDSWREVGNTEPLVAASYLYQPPSNTVVGLQTMYQRTVTASTYKHGGAERLRRRLEGRDRVCWINHVLKPLDIARILPKNMPDADKQKVLQEFALPGTTTAPLTSGRDIRLFLFLTCGLERYFERFWFGFRCTGTGTYVCHSFVDGAGRTLNINGNVLGGPVVGDWRLWRVHGQFVSPPNSRAANLPPAALFRWHYLQCVLKKFRHDDYFGVPNIRVPHADDWFDNYDSGCERAEFFDWDYWLRRMQAK